MAVYTAKRTCRGMVALTECAGAPHRHMASKAVSSFVSNAGKTMLDMIEQDRCASMKSKNALVVMTKPSMVGSPSVFRMSPRLANLLPASSLRSLLSSSSRIAGLVMGNARLPGQFLLDLVLNSLKGDEKIHVLALGHDAQVRNQLEDEIARLVSLISTTYWRSNTYSPPSLSPMSAMSSRMELLRSRMLLNFLKSTEKGRVGFGGPEGEKLLQAPNDIHSMPSAHDARHSL